mgnify:CR=1 FL=1
MKSVLIIALVASIAFAAAKSWNDDNTKIADDLITEVAAGENSIMIIFYKDQTSRSKLETKIKESKDFKGDFTLASVDMNSNKYMDLARDIRISNSADKDYPIIGMFKNGRGYIVKQYENESDIGEVVTKFNTLVTGQ